MKVFISWSGSTAQEVAAALKHWLKDVLTATEPWMSTEDIGAGIKWFQSVSENIESSDFGIVCITPETMKEPWVQFEAGALAKRVDQARVVPLLLGLSKDELSGPLSQFQAVESTKKDILKLVTDINDSIQEDKLRLDSDRLIRTFERCWPDLEQRLASALRMEGLDVSTIDKHKASEIFLRKLADPGTHKITILTYTNEVEVASINRYHLGSPKEITVFKRSIYADLAEQQECNLLRLQSGASVRRWDKRQISLKASEYLEEEGARSSAMDNRQLFYEGTPTRRAYIFDNREAIISFYERISDPLSRGGSLYKGMTPTPCLFVSATSPVGKYLLQEMIEYVAALEVACHSWQEEKEILEGGARKNSKRPCLNPRVVFVNLDTVIYDSSKTTEARPGAETLVSAIAASELEIWAITKGDVGSRSGVVGEDAVGRISSDRILTGMAENPIISSSHLYQHAMSRSGAKLGQAIAIDGDPVGIEAAESAGLFSIGIGMHQKDKRLLKTAGARVVFDHCDHLASEWHKVVEVLEM